MVVDIGKIQKRIEEIEGKTKILPNKVFTWYYLDELTEELVRAYMALRRVRRVILNSEAPPEEFVELGLRAESLERELHEFVLDLLIEIEAVRDEDVEGDWII